MRTSSETGPSSAIWNGGVLASFRSRMSRADFPGRQLRVDRVGRAALHDAGDADHELRAQALGHRHQRVVFADHDLRHPGAVADVEEGDAAEVADAVHPSEQHGLRADVFSAEGAAGMGSREIAERFRHRKNVLLGSLPPGSKPR
jgi:hypothetical protein